jgi:hypothetical protein
MVDVAEDEPAERGGAPIVGVHLGHRPGRDVGLHVVAVGRADVAAAEQLPEEVEVAALDVDLNARIIREEHRQADLERHRRLRVMVALEDGELDLVVLLQGALAHADERLDRGDQHLWMAAVDVELVSGRRRHVALVVGVRGVARTDDEGLLGAGCAVDQVVEAFQDPRRRLVEIVRLAGLLAVSEHAEVDVDDWVDLQQLFVGDLSAFGCLATHRPWRPS